MKDLWLRAGGPRGLGLGRTPGLSFPARQTTTARTRRTLPPTESES